MTLSRFSPGRLAPIDWMRGLVIALMALDHAGSLFDAGHLQYDSVAMHRPGSPLPWDHFLTRFVTHLCAPSFVFLAGTAMALSLAAAERRGRGGAAFDRHLLLRGGIICLLDPTLVSLFTSASGPGSWIVLQVLYAIGLSMVAMSVLRRVPAPALLAGAVGFFLLSDLLTFAVWDPRAGASAPVGLLVGFGYWPGADPAGLTVISLYPLVPWLAILVLGWVFGRRLCALQEEGRSPVRLLLAWGAAGLAVYVLVRGANGYGNLGLLREDGSLVQWLHVSKYPPSLSFTALTLGAMALLLAGFFRLAERARRPPSELNPLTVFGRVPLFFYVLHLPLLGLLGVTGLFGGLHAGGLSETYLAAATCVLILYPVCLAYGRYKAARRGGWTRYL